MIQYKNNAASNLLSGIADTDLSLTVGTGDGELFPALSGDDVFFVTLSGTIGYEIVKVTARSSDTFTIVRAQEGTTAKAFAMGDKVEMLITAGHLEDLRDNSLRIDNIPTTLITGLNAEKINGISAPSFVRTDYDSIIRDPYTLSFGSGSREVLYLSKQSYPDTYFNYVKLLVHCDGTNNSTTVLDSSLFARTLTCYNNAKLSSTQTKFGVSSLYFNGGSDNVRFTTPDMPLGGDNFTIEFWLYPTNITSGYRRYVSYETATNSVVIRQADLYYQCFFRFGSSTVVNLTTSTSPILNTWQHVALCRVSNTFTLYLNGVSIGSITNAGILDTSIPGWSLGQGSGESFTGYLDEIRFSSIARYTTNFTPDVVPFPDYVSGNDYDPYYGYVLTLLHGIGSEGGTNIYDSSPSPLTITNTGVTTRTAQFKFPTSSLYFTGSSYFTFPVTNYLNDLSTAFTIEFWIYATSANIDTNRWPVIYSAENSVNRRYSVYMHGTTGQTVYHIAFSNFVGFENLASSTTLNINQWYHVAFVCTGSKTVKVYVNGTFHSTATFTTTLNNGESLNHIIGDGYNFDDRFTGYLQDFRITKSIARYTGDFTPLQKLFPDKASQFLDPYYNKVSLLMHFNGANSSTSFIDSGPSAQSLTAYGNAQISSTQSKFGGTSGYFDGSGDYVQIEDSELFNFSSGDFTIEMWIYPTALPSSEYWWSLISQRTANRINHSFSFYLAPTGIPECIISNSGDGQSGTNAWVTGHAVSSNTWTHLAVTRASGTLRIFQNGILKNTSASANFTIYNSSATIKIGAFDSPPWSNSYFQGYMDEIRVTKGIARYTTDFLVPDSPFADAPVVYSLGTQIGGMYSRSTGRFDWYRGGVYSNIAGDAGANGYRGMTLTIDSSGNSSLTVASMSGDTGIKVGTGRTSDGYGYINFVTDTTYTDYGLRLIRNNSGANTTSFLYHRGTGALSITTVEAADLVLQTTSTDRLRVLSSGRILIGAGADDGSNLLQLNGNMAFIGTGRRIRGDFSNATQSSRTLFQSSTTNGSTAVGVIPNGISRISNVNCFSNPDPTNTSFIQIRASDTENRITSGVTGTGTALPLTFWIDTNEYMRLTTAGRILIGTTTDGGYAKLTVSGGNTPIAPISDTVLHLVNNNSQARLLIDAYSDSVSSVITARRSRGNATTPTAVQANDVLLSITGTGYSNAWINSARAILFINASQNWTATANGTYFAFNTTANDTTTHSERMRITDSGRILIGTTTDDTLHNVQVVGVAGVNSGIVFRTYGTNGLGPSSHCRLMAARGTAASPSAIQSADRIATFITDSQYSSSASRSVASMEIMASENHDATHAGTRLIFRTCANGSIDRLQRMEISGSGRILIGTETDDATNLLQVNGSIVQRPLASVTPTNNGELVFEATSNTTITVKYKGSDGTVRTGTITLT